MYRRYLMSPFDVDCTANDLSILSTASCCKIISARDERYFLEILLQFKSVNYDIITIVKMKLDKRKK